ncbi:hypothetical protein RR48_03432 [Papilio machaon]|uniref:Uncharacterized protein n=1 Tax=Papilio machaon TaxID=76193 RepID=A0A0N0PB09_PAPMA|nr:hypothetical protein RR48_03432 [Papilio machaon]
MALGVEGFNDSILAMAADAAPRCRFMKSNNILFIPADSVRALRLPRHLILFLFLLSFVVINCQYFADPAFKPDIRFDDHNDRFDLKPLLRFQKNYFKYPAHRRNFRKTIINNNDRRSGWKIINSKHTDKDTEVVIKKIKNKVKHELENIAKHIGNWRRFNKNDIIEINDNDYQRQEEIPIRKSLNNIFINLDNNRRKTKHDGITNENEAIFNYAFPVHMVVRGYMTMPAVF